MKLQINGEEYVDKLTNRLKNIEFNNFYSSTSPRTQKTIEKLAVLKNKNIIQSEDLYEMYFGIYDGMKWDDVNKINPNINENHIKTNEIIGIPEQETTEEVAKRMYEYITKISKENFGKNILICSHGVAIEAFLRKITNVPFLDKIDEYSQKNTSLNILEYDSELNKFKIVLLNDLTHLKDSYES